MAQYPTLEEYQKKGNYEDGIKRCDDLLKKRPTDPELWRVKLQLSYATGHDNEAVLDQMLALERPVIDLAEIEHDLFESQSNKYPLPQTVGSKIAKLWDNAAKSMTSMNSKLELQQLRFARAMGDNRLIDAQQALIQLKALQPKNRVIYMAHAAVTQLMSTSNDDLHARLALMLARKAVSDKFDDDAALDCRVPGQIFAIQGSVKDLEGIRERSFKESKQVYDALRKLKPREVNGTAKVEDVKDPATVPASEWLASEVHMLKQQYSELTGASAELGTFLTFAANATRLFHTASTSIPNDRARGTIDACFLAISGLVRAFELTDESHHLLQAAYLAETLLKKRPNIHEARMILIYLYMRLGLGSLALRYCESLRLKEIQYDTVGHAIFTRISVTHPHKTKIGKKDTMEPLKTTSHTLNVYTRWEEKLAESETNVLSYGNTGMMFDLHELRSSMRSSVSRRITHLEQRRIDRLLNNTSGEDTAAMGPKVVANWLDVTDNRDFATTFDYGYNVEKVLQSREGTLPGKNWTLCSLAMDAAWCQAMQLPAPINDIESLIREIVNMPIDVGRLQINDESSSGLGVSDAEYLAADLACQVLKLLRFLATKPDTTDEYLVASINTSLETLHIDALVTTPDPFTERLRDHYIFLDILRTVIKACSRYHKLDELQKLYETSRAVCVSIQLHAKEQMKVVNLQGIKTLLEKEGDMCESIKLFGDGTVKTFCESIVASAKEGWEGLTKIKIL